jgi:hypothetical protein
VFRKSNHALLHIVQLAISSNLVAGFYLWYMVILPVKAVNYTVMHTKYHQEPWFPSAIPTWSSQLWCLWQNLIPSDWEIHASCHQGDGLYWIYTFCTSGQKCSNMYTSSERHICYTLCRGCSFAGTVYTMHGNVCAILRPSPIHHLSTIAIHIWCRTLPAYV